MEIPNWVSGVIIGGFVIFAATHWSSIDLRMHLVIAVTLFIVTYGFWLAGWLGGGDVKLLTAVGLWLGPHHSLAFIIYLAIISSLLSIGLIIVRRQTRNTDISKYSASMQRVASIAATGACPYAIAIGLAGFATLPKLFV